MADLVSAMYADVGPPVASTIFATDSMSANAHDLGGYGVVACRVTQAQVEQCFEEALQPGFVVCHLSKPFR